MLAAVLILLVFGCVHTGSGKYDSKGQQSAGRTTIMKNQATMNWLGAGCPSLAPPKSK